MIEIEALGDSAIIVRFGRLVDDALNDRVLALVASLDRDPLPGQRDVVPAFASVAVRYDPCAIPASVDALTSREAPATGLARSSGDARLAERSSLAVLSALLRERCDALAPLEHSSRLHEIPVCYDRAVALDLDAIAARCGLDAAAVVALHAAAEYRVHMIGFTPGFPYLGGLDGRLVVPRRESPRHRVPAGSVAIGGAQTGIYPDEAPGGWWIIGRTPLRLFDPFCDPPALLAAGDRVRFRAIAIEELAARATASTGSEA